MRVWLALVSALSLMYTGCGDDTGLGVNAGDCGSNVLPGDYTVRSAQEAIAVQRKGGCGYSITGDLNITRTQLRVF